MSLEEARRAVQEELAATGSPGGVVDPHTSENSRLAVVDLSIYAAYAGVVPEFTCILL